VRGLLKNFAAEQYEREGYTLNAANEIEGFLFEGIDAEQRFLSHGAVRLCEPPAAITTRCPGDPLRRFIDTAAEVQRAMGFENEKDHSRGWRRRSSRSITATGEVVNAADQIQLYKLICRQVARKMGMTASFLPKPVVGRERQRDAHQTCRST